MTIALYALTLALAVVGGLLGILVLELRRARRPVPRPPAGTVVGPTPDHVAPAGVDEEKWMQTQKQRVLKRLRADFPKLSGDALETAAREILEKGRTTLARIR